MLAIGSWAIIKYPPTGVLEVLVVTATGFAMLMIGGWATGKRKWGVFLVWLFLGIPVLKRLELLNPITAAGWLLILGLISLIG